MTLTYEELPISSSYSTRDSGRDLGQTMPMWRVQTEGYRDEKGMLIGVVTPAGLDSSPDGEYISGGLNTKGCDSTAIGRQGNFLHWGFAASPTYMTEEARLVFVNAIHYIRKFDGHRAFVRKTSMVTRASVDDALYGLSDQGFAAWSRLIEESNAKRAKMADEIRAREAKGEKLTGWERQILNMPASKPWSRGQSIKHLASEALQEQLSEDWDAYAEYFTENRPYLHPVKEGSWRQPLVVDEDARALGIPNHDVALLEKCVSILESRNEESQESRDRAERLLTRYTLESFETAPEWRKWLDRHRGRLFFSEFDGFHFLVNPAAGSGRPVPASLKATIDALEVPAPTNATPVQLEATIYPRSARAGEIVTLVIKARILPGWHIYGKVPPGQPYVGTTLTLNAPKAMSPVGAWEHSDSTVSPTAPGVPVYENECVFEHRLRLSADVSGAQTVKATVGYQACDERMCLPPAQVEVSASVN